MSWRPRGPELLLPIEGLSRMLGLRPRGVLHVGAHLAEELEDYRQAGWGPRTWIEALPDLVSDLRIRFADAVEDLIVEGAAWEVGGLSLQLNRTNLDASSSILPLGTHRDVRPDIDVIGTVTVTTISLDEAIRTHRSMFGHEPELLNLDIQGAELAALRGLPEDFPFDWILTEVAWREFYLGQPLLDDVERFLTERGYVRAALLKVDEAGWGDALYARGTVWGSIATGRRARFRLWVWALQTRRRMTLARVLSHRRLRRARRGLRSATRAVMPTPLLRIRRRLTAPDAPSGAGDLRHDG